MTARVDGTRRSRRLLLQVAGGAIALVAALLSGHAHPASAAAAPGAPTAVTATTSAADEITVSWTAPATDGGSAVGGYEVTPSIGGVAGSVRSFPGSTATSQKIGGLARNTTYTFRVAATNAIGTGPLSSASTPVTAAGPATPPTDATATAGNGRAIITWHAPASDGSSPITKYLITPFIGTTAQPNVTSTGTGTSRVVLNLTNGTTYTFKVSAQNAFGPGARSIATAAVTPQPYAPFNSWAAFVPRQYLDLTSVAPANAALDQWVGSLIQGTVTRGDLIDALRLGHDNTANVDPVARLYRAFLGRAPDAGGLRFWINRKRAGTWSVTRMADSFAGSNEFKTKYGSLTNKAFVTRIYTDVLARTADSSGVTYWTSKLDRKVKTRGQVMVGFSESNEYRRKQRENTDVAIAYTYLLGRVPTPAETDDWVTRQKAPTPQADLANELLDSSKYIRHILA